MAIEYGSVKWATNQLRYAISIMFGGDKVIISLPKGRIQLAEYLKRDLEEHGYMMKADILQHQINRYKKQLKEENRRKRQVKTEEPKPVLRNANEVKLHEFMVLTM